MNNKRSLKIGIVAVILLLAIGFAAVTTTLLITGSAKISADNDNFQSNILFASAQLSKDGKNVNGASITETKNTADTIVFNIPDVMTAIGEEYVLTYTIRNNSQYSAKLGRLECTMESSNPKFDPNEYLSVVATNKNAGKTIARNAVSSEDTVVVRLKKSYTGEINGEELGPITVTITGHIVSEPDTFADASASKSAAASNEATGITDPDVSTEDSEPAPLP